MSGTVYAVVLANAAARRVTTMAYRDFLVAALVSAKAVGGRVFIHDPRMPAVRDDVGRR